MSMPEALTLEVLLVLGAALLFHAGSAKLMAPRPIRDTLAGLGIPARLTPTVAVLVAVVELLTALLVIVVRGYVATALLVLLGSTFAAVGLWSLATGRQVACNCFGPRSGGSTLGWRQLAYLPLWLGFGALLLTPLALQAPIEYRLAGGNAALLVAFALTARHVAPHLLQARSTRVPGSVPS